MRLLTELQFCPTSSKKKQIASAVCFFFPFSYGAEPLAVCAANSKVCGSRHIKVCTNLIRKRWFRAQQGISHRDLREQYFTIFASNYFNSHNRTISLEKNNGL